MKIFQVLLLGVLFAALIQQASPLLAQVATSLELYEVVIQEIREKHPGMPLNLNNTVLRLECQRGGCNEPWAGTLPQEWLANARSRGLIANYCISYGYCNRTAIPRIPGSIGVMFTTERPCGEGCVELVAHETVPVNPRSEEQVYNLYRLERATGGWAVTSVKEIARGHLDG